ncbi:hypothetical protein NPS53_07900 [Pseudomonas putida]|uniref:hypothetical protein n=1 Tax=Pseudomonas putida TaxID=303 RepID=UPI002364308B|nr:hypothetical protein [Pseudomonas putida]MDD2139492.1 hypothetical protein [Pseudomonas putida]HDS1721821.1 hypothetical protein [Pseudomonas putida]
MEAGFVVSPVAVGFVYGGMAPAILEDLALSYQAEVGIQARHWAMWVFPNGSSVPVPTQIDATQVPAIRACLLLKRTLQKVAQHEMRRMTEADKFNINTALSQLDQINTIGIA